LPNYLDSKTIPEESKWAELREAQSLTAREVKNCGIVVTIDLGESHDIHPLNKKDVGYRLALAAEKIAYHENGIVDCGPVYKSMKIVENKIELTFSNTGSGVVSIDGKELSRFSIAVPDKKLVWAKATIVVDMVIVESPDVANPVAVRYAWATNPGSCNLYDKEGFPATAFSTYKD
jgi:sialate O-acetylesterase